MPPQVFMLLLYGRTNDVIESVETIRTSFTRGGSRVLDRSSPGLLHCVSTCTLNGDLCSTTEPHTNTYLHFLERRYPAWTCLSACCPYVYDECSGRPQEDILILPIAEAMPQVPSGHPVLFIDLNGCVESVCASYAFCAFGY